MPTTILVAPTGRGVGLTSACLGIVRALERQGIQTAFVKPIANRERVHTAELLELAGHIASLPSILRTVADELLAGGDEQLLMEHVVESWDRRARTPTSSSPKGSGPSRAWCTRAA